MYWSDASRLTSGQTACKSPLATSRSCARWPPSLGRNSGAGDADSARRPGFPSPYGHRHSLPGHPIPAGELGSPHGRLTGPRAGPRRGYRVPLARAATGVGAPYTPRTAVLFPDCRTCLASACRSTAASPSTPLHHPIWRGLLYEASTRVQAIHPSGLPLACGPRMERTIASAFPRASHPADQEPDSARQGGDRPPSTDLEQRSRHQLSNLQSACPLDCVRHRVAQSEGAVRRAVSVAVRRATPLCQRPVRRSPSRNL
jgi:hypothetical protein